MNLAISAVNTLSTRAQATSQKIARMIDQQYSNIIQMIRVRKRLLELKKLMNKARSYSQWKEYAVEYDTLKNVKKWKEKETGHFDWKYIKNVTDTLKTLRVCGQYRRVMHVIRSNCSRNIGNILNPKLYYKSFVGTKTIIEEYQAEVIACLDYIANLKDNQLSKGKKVEFFAEARHAFGKTALLMSGGEGLGIYHYGVIKTFVERNMFPRIIAGSSVGSVFAALVGVTKPQDLHKLSDPNYLNVSAYKNKPGKFSFLRKLKRLITEGHLLDRNVLIQFLRDNLGDVTFQQAYDQTGWILNISVIGNGFNDGNHILNYLTAPNVLVWSAVMASCSMPLFFGAMPIYCKNDNNDVVPYNEGDKKFVNGSLGGDVPIKKLSEFFNINFFVVSQANPWVIPFMDHSEQYRHSKREFFLQIWEYFKAFILSEAFYRVEQLRGLGILPQGVLRYFDLITQVYTGNVTIWPVPHFTELFMILKNPSHERLVKGAIGGARSTYPKINRIEVALAIEKALEINHQKLRRSILKQHKKQEMIEDYDAGPYNSDPEPSHQEQLSGSERVDDLALPRVSSDDGFTR